MQCCFAISGVGIRHLNACLQKYLVAEISIIQLLCPPHPPHSPFMFLPGDEVNKSHGDKTTGLPIHLHLKPLEINWEGNRINAISNCLWAMHDWWIMQHRSTWLFCQRNSGSPWLLSVSIDSKCWSQHLCLYEYSSLSPSIPMPCRYQSAYLHRFDDNAN